MPIIGMLDARSPGTIENLLRAFRQGLCVASLYTEDANAFPPGFGNCGCVCGQASPRPTSSFQNRPAARLTSDCIIICPSGRVDPGRCSAGSKDPTACRSRRCNRACRRGRPPPESRGREVEGRRARWAAAAQCNDMIQALATDRSDQPLGKTVLPRRARRYGLVADAHGP
jgi:hypothetical protein